MASQISAALPLTEVLDAVIYAAEIAGGYYTIKRIGTEKERSLRRELMAEELSKFERMFDNIQYAKNVASYVVTQRMLLKAAQTRNSYK